MFGSGLLCMHRVCTLEAGPVRHLDRWFWASITRDQSTLGRMLLLKANVTTTRWTGKPNIAHWKSRQDGQRADDVMKETHIVASYQGISGSFDPCDRTVMQASRVPQRSARHFYLELDRMYRRQNSDRTNLECEQDIAT